MEAAAVELLDELEELLREEKVVDERLEATDDEADCTEEDDTDDVKTGEVADCELEEDEVVVATPVCCEINPNPCDQEDNHHYYNSNRPRQTIRAFSVHKMVTSKLERTSYSGGISA